MISDDKYIELLVAGINQLSMPAADIQHDVNIGGRQFDVVAQLEAGLHRIMLAYEVKNKSRRVSVDQIDAFVTKARDANADKTIFVSTAGFQSGCFTVADRHGVDLFQLTFLDKPTVSKLAAHMIMSKAPATGFNEPPEIKIGSPGPIPSIPRVTLHYRNGDRVTLPDEPSQMQYYMERTIVSPDTSLNDIVGRNLPAIINVGDKETKVVKAGFGRSFKINPPDEFFFPAGNLKAIEFDTIGVLGVPLTGNTAIESSALSYPVQYRNLKTGSAFEADIATIPVGPDTLRVGEFYFGYHPLRYYYCDGYEGSLMRLYLVESFQMAELVQAIMRQEAKYSYFYIQVTDKKIINRLKKRLDKMKNNSR
ncbi:restriction endonuclease [uncultured Tateyamaria sp.]|uniref:restriction endonuclease n=1 Tax=uncultured Tateyamaria sp. TaxID=455651 RepID=UPI0026344229|nr:restriction endonuclease [uncultured Tateyamaria sp.]